MTRIERIRNMTTKIYLLNAYQRGSRAEIDTEYKEDYVEVEAEPEAEFR